MIRRGNQRDIRLSNHRVNPRVNRLGSLQGCQLVFQAAIRPASLQTYHHFNRPVNRLTIRRANLQRYLRLYRLTNPHSNQVGNRHLHRLGFLVDNLQIIPLRSRQHTLQYHRRGNRVDNHLLFPLRSQVHIHRQYQVRIHRPCPLISLQAYLLANLVEFLRDYHQVNHLDNQPYCLLASLQIFQRNRLLSLLVIPRKYPAHSLLGVRLVLQQVRQALTRSIVRCVILQRH